MIVYVRSLLSPNKINQLMFFLFYILHLFLLTKIKEVVEPFVFGGFPCPIYKKGQLHIHGILAPTRLEGR